MLTVFVVSALTVCLTLLLAREGPRGRGLSLFRALIPSFRFFDRAPEVPALAVRSGRDESALGAFRSVLQPTPFRFGHLLLNAEGNLRLAYYGLLEQLTSDLSELREGDSEGASALVSYALVAELARLLVRESRESDARVYQFKLTLGASSENPSEQTLLVSALHEV